MLLGLKNIVLEKIAPSSSQIPYVHPNLVLRQNRSQRRTLEKIEHFPNEDKFDLSEEVQCHSTDNVLG